MDKEKSKRKIVSITKDKKQTRVSIPSDIVNEFDINPDKFLSAGNVTTITIPQASTGFSGGPAGTAYEMNVIISYQDNRLDPTKYPGFNSTGIIRSSIEK